MIGGPDTIVDYECSAARAVQFNPHATRITHTNHPLANDDLAYARQRDAASVADRSPMSNSEARLAVLDKVAGHNETVLDAETITAVLRTTDVPVSVSRQSAGDGMTLGSVVMELGTRPVLHYAPGPPAETAYSRWTF